jgi:F420-dependent oxidoreductase-like protein
MQLDLNIGYWGAALAPEPSLLIEAEKLGYRCVWAAEAYGSDAATVLAAIAARTERIGIGSAIFQMPARTPAMTAMTAATLDEISGGRFRLGLGLSGPQVVEGWHGVPYGRPLARTREYVEVVRAILGRSEPVVHHGEEYRIPYDGPDATGLGKPLKLIGSAHPAIPVYVASIGPANVALTAEIADGWLPAFYSPEGAPEAFAGSLERGFARSGNSAKRSQFDIVAAVQAVVDDDVAVARDQVRPQIALYVGGMGAKGRNFYHALACTYGYEAAADRCQELFLAGDKAAAVAAVPDALVDEVALVGPRERIRDRLEAWKEADVDSLSIASLDLGTLRVIAELVG